MNFAKFFEASEGFLKALAVGPNHRLQRMPAFLTRSGKDPSHVALGFASFEELMNRQTRQGIGQLVSHLFELTAQKGVVQSEATIILEDTPRFARTIGRRIQ